MDYNQLELKKALKELSENYPDNLVNNNKNINSIVIKNENFVRLSMKRSNIRKVTFDKCCLKNTAFNGSIYQYVHFDNCVMEGNSFANCNFYSSEIYGEKSKSYIGNNYSQSNFTKCNFLFDHFISCSFLQTLFHQCELNNICIQSSLLEGSQFINCKIIDTDFGSVNIEFSEFRNTELNKVIFPFYQFPYVIGAADYINELDSSIFLRANQREIDMKAYKKQITNLIYYFEDKLEYFPMCNLQIAISKNNQAIQTLLEGIDISLRELDFRMVRHYCRLAWHHNLLDELTVKKISDTIESFLSKNDIPPEQLNNCIIHLGEIRKLLLSGNKDSIKLNLNVRTNIDKNDKQGIHYVNELCNQLNYALSNNDFGQTGFQVAISNHSPYEIIIDVIATAANITGIAEFIWYIIDKHKKDVAINKEEFIKNYIQTDVDIYKQYLDTRIELCKEKLLKIKNTYSQKKMNAYIEEITQQLQTDIAELYDKDIMIFVKKN